MQKPMCHGDDEREQEQFHIFLHDEVILAKPGQAQAAHAFYPLSLCWGSAWCCPVAAWLTHSAELVLPKMLPQVSIITIPGHSGHSSSSQLTHGTFGDLQD